MNYLRYGLQAAALADLLRQRRIAVEAGQVVVLNTGPPGDELLEVALSRLAASRRPGKLTTWVRGLYRDRKLPVEVVTNRLVRRGILTRQEAPLLWIFRRTVYPTSNPGPEQAVRRRIEEALLGGGKADETTAILIALLQACRALRLVVDKSALKALKPTIQAVCASSPVAQVVGQALAKAIEEDEAAAAVVAVVAAGSG